VEEMTWEAEEEMKSKYPHLFQTKDMDQDKIRKHWPCVACIVCFMAACRFVLV